MFLCTWHGEGSWSIGCHHWFGGWLFVWMAVNLRLSGLKDIQIWHGGYGWLFCGGSVWLGGRKTVERRLCLVGLLLSSPPHGGATGRGFFNTPLNYSAGGRHCVGRLEGGSLSLALIARSLKVQEVSGERG